MSNAEDLFHDEVSDVEQPMTVSDYPEEYTGSIETLNPELLIGLGRLMHDLNPEYSGDPVPAEALQAQLEQPTCKQIIAIREGCLVGTASASVGWELYAGKFIQLGSVVVHPAYRGVKDESGHSVIDHILGSVENFAREQEATQILFEVDPSNGRAQSAYARWGADQINTAFYVKQIQNNQPIDENTPPLEPPVESY